jgi:DNA-binding MurR/RpiR family transcriptional regulator
LKLREQSKLFSTTEQEIAAYILEDPQLVVEMSIHELARHTFSSASSIVRLCNHTGYSGYREFRKAVTYELALREQSQQLEHKELVPSDSLQDIIDKVTYANIISLEETRALIDVNVLRACVDLIKNARRICFFGLGASQVAAQDAYLKFLRLNRPATVNMDLHAQILQAKTADRQDLAIVISYSGTTAEIVDCMKIMKENGVPIIAITRCVNSPVSELADQKLYTPATESLFRSSAMACLTSQLTVIDILYTALANDRHEASLEQLSRTRIHNPDR